jgi:hypothetical protein
MNEKDLQTHIEMRLADMHAAINTRFAEMQTVLELRTYTTQVAVDKAVIDNINEKIDIYFLDAEKSLDKLKALLYVRRGF